jgi:tetratricopeptide (TPR) repeat protein
MYQLTLLGSPALLDRQGRDIAVLTNQPERLLLLGWMACEEPVGFHRREELLERFFPTGDADARRNALRQALHALRTHIDPGIFIARGSDELCVNLALLRCDLSELRTRLRAGENVDRERVAEFAEGVELDSLPMPVAGWVASRREEVTAIRNGTAEFAVPAPPSESTDAPSERSRSRPTPPVERVAIPKEPLDTRGSSTTRPDYAERLSAATAEKRARPGDAPEARAWTWLAAAAFLALVGTGGWLWWRNRPASLPEPVAAVAPDTTVVDSAAVSEPIPLRDADAYLAAIDADSFAKAEQLARAWAARAPTDPAPLKLLARQHVLDRRLAAAALLVDSARARGAGEGWAREERLVGAMAGGSWSLARDIILDSTSAGMTGSRSRWWRTTFEWMRGRPASAAEFGQRLVAENAQPADSQFTPVSTAQVVGLTVGALLDAGRPVAAQALLASAPLPTDLADSVRRVVWRGRALAMIGDTAQLSRVADSLDAATRGRSLGRDAALPVYLRAVAREARGDVSAALPLYLQALESSRTGAPVIKVAAARALVAQGRAAEAIPILRSALRSPILVLGGDGVPYPNVHEALAAAHLAMGAVDSAGVHAITAYNAWNEAEPVFRARVNALRRGFGSARRTRVDTSARRGRRDQLE